MTFKTDYEKSYFSFVKQVRERVKQQYLATKTQPVGDKAGFALIKRYDEQLSPYYGIRRAVSLKKMLLTFNQPDNLKKTYYVNRLGNLVGDLGTIGAEVNSIESFRDLKIYRNALSTIRKETNKVLIIYGAAHVHIMAETFRLDDRFNVINVKDLIK